MSSGGRIEGKSKIDAKDKKILAALSDNSRLPATAIAKKIGLSRDAVAYRIENYEKKGITEGYKTIVNINKFGYDSYHIFIRLSQTSEQAEKKFIAKLESNPRVRAILKFSGKYDFELALIAKNLLDFDSLIGELLSDISEFISDYEILGLTKNYVSRALPKSFLETHPEEKHTKYEEGHDFDKKDLQILQAIANNSNAPMHEIATKSSLSADAVTYRIKRMQRQGTILKFTTAINYKKLGYDEYTILISIPNLPIDKENKLRELLATDENITWAVKTIGKYNVLMYVCVDNAEKLHNTLIRIRSAFPTEVKSYETLVTYDRYKYTYFPENLELL